MGTKTKIEESLPLVDFCGASILIRFAFLPDKTEISYFMVVLFLFFAFNKYRNEIKKSDFFAEIEIRF